MSRLIAFFTLAIAAQLASAVVPLWGQCGGQNWPGETTCAAGSACVYSNPYYSQCLPATSTSTSTKPTTTSSSTSTKPTTTSSTTTSQVTSTSSTTTTSTSVTTSTSTTTGQLPTVTYIPSPAGTGLHGRFVAAGKEYWGACADPNTLSIPANNDVLVSDFGQLTPENSMKWERCQTTRGQFDFTASDIFVNWAVANGKLIRGHTFVWHSQLPSWVSNIGDKATLTAVIQNHIETLGGRYKGKIYHWDVVNEMFNENGSVRSSVFSRLFGGDSFVNFAFSTARRVDPDASLYINDYNLDSANAKVNGMVGVVRKVNSAGPRLIDGCGTQMHLTGGNSGGVAGAINALASADCDVAITELDIAGASSSEYTFVVRSCLNQPRCIGITSWGVSDANSWQVRTSPLLFDGNYRPKAAYTAIMNMLPTAPASIPVTITPTPTSTSTTIISTSVITTTTSIVTSATTASTSLTTPTSSSTIPTSTTTQATSTVTSDTSTITQITTATTSTATTTKISSTTAIPTVTGLHNSFVKRGKRFWGVAADDVILSVPSAESIIKAEFGQVTPENSMKWDNIEPARDQFDFTHADALVNWATSNGKLIRGYTFVWHSQLPLWVSSITSRSTLTLVIQSHIAIIAARYRGKWDVVNEIFKEDGSLRSSIFSTVFGGDGFVNVAFETARQIDNNAKLYINDYNLDAPNPKVAAVVALVKKLNSGATKLVDGVGTQMHLNAGGASDTKAAVSALAVEDVEVAITELDIAGASPADYTTVLQSCLLNTNCVSITSWGISDATSWRPTATPLLFDADYAPKDAYFALLESIPVQ